jgi:hypothetical protein
VYVLIDLPLDKGRHGHFAGSRRRLEMQIARPTRERQPAVAPQPNGGRKSRREAAPAPIGRRAQGEEFSSSFDQLQREVREACGRESEWEARIRAGIRAALEFAAAHPGEARALTIEASSADSPVDRQDDVIAYFVGLLGEAAPPERLFPIAADRAMVAAIAMIVRSHLVSGSAGLLPELAPGLAHMILMPYTGLAGARHEAEAAASR